MNQLFRKLPLSFKLILIGVIPLVFIIYLTWQVYEEKNKNIIIIEGNIEGIKEIGDITSLIHQLQEEQKLSFDVLRKKNAVGQLLRQRMITDSCLKKLRRSNDYVLKGFETYTSLHNLKSIRNKMDGGFMGTELVTHYYSNTIFRLNTLISTPYGGQTVLEPFYDDIQSQKLLTEIITYLRIIRTNIYNVLTTRQYMMETLFGSIGAYDVFKSYEEEFKLKASAGTLAAYNNTRNSTAVKPAVEYLDKLFTGFNFDSTYTAEQWWALSENGLQQLSALRQTIWNKLNRNIDAVHKREINRKNLTLILLIFVTVIVLGIIAYTITIITKMLAELKEGAEKIARGGSGLQFNIRSQDAIGSLARSIVKIDENNKQLTNAAEQIGKGNFAAPIHARSDEDILANAIISMKDNLQSSIKALEESEERFKQLADLIPQIVWTADENGHPDYLNRQWFEYAGNLEFSSVIHPADAEKTKNLWLKAFADAKDFSMETRLLNHLTSQYRWFLIRASPIQDGHGKIVKWFGTSTDIHERKTMSEELEKLVQKRTIELKRSNDDLLQFAHVASHDMKEPLRKVRFFADRLHAELGEETPEKLKAYLSKINLAAERLTVMIDGVLKFSTINNDGGEFERVDLNNIVEGIVNDLEIIIQQKNAVISFMPLPAIKGVPVLIHQLFYNLIVNALKFSKEGIAPVVTISARNVQLKETNFSSLLHAGDQYLEIAIKDNGIGFSEAMNNKVFDVFTRLHARDKYEGTGLGLALCKKIMERHDGNIYVKSEEGEGSVFYLLLHETFVAEKKSPAIAFETKLA